MYCPYCGSAVSQSAQFCGSCGKRKNALASPRAKTKRPLPLKEIILLLACLWVVAVLHGLQIFFTILILISIYLWQRVRLPYKIKAGAIVLFVVGLFGSTAYYSRVKDEAKAKAVAAEEQSAREAAEAFGEMTSSEHLAAAKQLSGGIGVSKADVQLNRAELEMALKHLAAIPTDSPQYPAVKVLQQKDQKLLARLDREEQEQKAREAWEASHPSQEVPAGMACEDYVKASLVAPSTADFQSFLGRQVADLGNWNYSVSSYVDSQNSFGAKIRTYFTCQVHCVAKNKCVVTDISTSPG
jgi:hypothetical protein